MNTEQMIAILSQKFLEKALEYGKLTQEEKDNSYMKVYYVAIMKSMEESCKITLEVMKEIK